MNINCKNCGKEISSDNKFCPYCGAKVSADEPVGADIIRPSESGSEPAGEGNIHPSENEPKPKPKPVAKPLPKPAPNPAAPDGKKKRSKKAKQPKGTKKKKRVPGIVKFLIVILCIAGAVALLWYAVGNYFTLKAHSDKFMKSVNSGNLDFSEFQTDTYEDIPEYVKEMMGETAEDHMPGPIMNAMADHITVERVKINGFFGGKTVEYKVSAKDLGTWLLELDYSSVSSSEQLQQMMLEQLPGLETAEFSVTIEHTKKGFFSWTGEYETREFADALTGGLNTAYNTLYNRMYEELEGLAE